jgi:hypothetical protein
MVKASETEDQIHVFRRQKHHSDFTYLGTAIMELLIFRRFWTFWGVPPKTGEPLFKHFSERSKMKTQSSDTHSEIEKVLISLLQNSSVAKRMSKVRSLSESTIKLSRRAIRRANPGLDETELNLKFISHHYGERLAALLREHMKRKTF